MNKSDFNFNLPEELIAQNPIKNRSSSRLLIMDRKTGKLEHSIFENILNYLREGDCLVLNNTKVMPARLVGERENTKGKVEILLLNRKEKDIWEVLVKNGKKAKIGYKINFGNGILKAEVIDIVKEGIRVLKFFYNGIFEEILEKIGDMPLPPYIHEKLDDKNRYQTVYAKENGSIAAPTAGLHFTKDLISKIKNKGIKISYITLHVGLGTFRPVKEENILKHKMHKEFYTIDKHQAKIINETKKNKGRIIAVGTTSCRALESCSNNNKIDSRSEYTDIFIYPGYNFKIVDAIITNFHLPQSTLLMLISAFSNLKNVINAYNIAVKEKYKFFSFGDVMLIQ